MHADLWCINCGDYVTKSGDAGKEEFFCCCERPELEAKKVLVSLQQASK